MEQKHSRPTKNGRAVWLTERLWELSKDLSVRSVRIEDIPEFEMNCWFDAGSEPTCRAIAEHALKISRVKLDYPIILSADGRLMDGGHRVCKAWMLGRDHIEGVQFGVDPEPDYVLES